MITTKELIFLSIAILLLSFAIGSILGWNYGSGEALKEFDGYIKQAKEARAKAEETQIETMKIQSEARRILMEARQ